MPRGATYGFIGPSGAGKTTCIRMIMSILFPDSGELSVLGHASALEAKDRIGYLPEERGVYRKMQRRRFLTYMAQLKGVSATRRLRACRALLERVGLRRHREEALRGAVERDAAARAVRRRDHQSSPICSFSTSRSAASIRSACGC